MMKKVAVEIDIQGTKDVIELQKQIRQTKKELRETEDIEAFDKLATDLVKLQAQLKEARKAQRQAVDAFTATDEGVGAYSRLSAQLRVARNNLKDLQAAGTTTGDEVDKLTAEINELDSTLKDIDRSVGQTNREVGAYEEAVRKAVGITDAQAGAFTRLKGRADVLRKAYRDVATAQGENSEAAQKLQKELNKVERQLKAVGGTADKTGGRIKSARSQFREFAGGLGAVGGAFVAFEALPGAIQNLQAFAAGLENVLGFLSPSIALNSRFANSVGETAQQFVEQKQGLNEAFEAIKQTKAGTDEYNEAIATATEQFPFLNDELVQQKLLLNDVEGAQKAATQALIKDLAAQAQRKQASAIIDEFAQAESKRAALQAEAESTVGQVANTLAEGTTSVIDFFLGATGTFQTNLTEANEAFIDAEQKSLEQQFENVGEVGSRTEDFLNKFNKQLEQLFGEQETTQTNSNKNKLDEEKKQAERLAKEAARAAAQRARQQESFLKQEQSKAEARANLLTALERQIIKAQLDAQEEGQQKALAQELQALNERTTALETQRDKFIQELEAQQQKINELFGAESQRAINFAQTVSEQRQKINEQTNAAIEAETILSEQAQQDIRKKFADEEAQAAKTALQKRLQELNQERQAVANAVNQELLEIREARARGRITEAQAEKQSFEARLQSLKDQLSQLNKEEFALISEQGFGAEIAQTEFDKIAAARQNLNTQLAELEEAQTKKVNEEAEKQSEARQKSLEFALNAVSDVVGGIGEIAELANAAETRRLEALQAERQRNIESLNSELQNASGLEKAFLEQRVQQETRAAQEIAAAQEAARKKAAAAQKAVSITQAVINTALGVTQALASLPPPFSFITAAITGALGAVQIATIAAQPLATGGIVGFNNGGKVNQKQNIKTQPNGDNVLATLKRGEVVLNQRQQAALGGASTFKSIGVPGFNTGGIVSPPINAPTLAQTSKDAGQVQELIEQTRQLTIATNARIDRLQVEYTTRTQEQIDNDQKDRKEIQTRNTL